MNKENHATGEMAASSPRVPGAEHRGLKVLLTAVLTAGLLIYAACLFKNISYPLMWADESMTAVGAQRVLAFGYPKVHDGRNIFYDLRHTDLSLGIDEETDAYIGGAGWGQYYFAAPFVVLARFTPDLYRKTAILRIPFALAGLAGLLLLLRTGTRFIATRQSRLAMAALFVVLELPNVTLMLHLREVRYYALQLLVSAIALSTFAAWHLRSSISYRTYATAVICLVPLLFLTFSPASVAFVMTLCLYLGGEWLASAVRQRRADISSLRVPFRSLAPLLASMALVAPLAWFFRTLYISRRLEEFYNYSFATYLEHLGVVWSYFARYEIIVFAIAAKFALALFWRQARNEAGLHPALKLSLLLSVYIVAEALVIGKVPNQLFTRYFITLQPLLVLAFALDLAILARIIMAMGGRQRAAGAAVVVILLAGSVGWGFSQNWPLIKGRLYEISHRYEGVLDYVIPYLQKRYRHPDRLVIATNYEETSYVYYLNCRVIVGFLTPNLEKDRQERPDCIIYRGFWTFITDKGIYDDFLSRGTYEMVRFPVYDDGVNNIPETVHWTPRWGWQQPGGAALHAYRREDWNSPWGWQLQHNFGTVTTDIPNYQATLYLRTDATAGTKRNEDGR